MKWKLLSDLWKYTALPIVLFLTVLISFVSFAQYRALSIQSQPILIKISRTDRIENTPEAVRNEELPKVAAGTEEGLIFNEVRSALSEGDYEEALAKLDSIEVPSDKLELEYFYRGYINNRLEDKNKAVESYRKALEIEPNYYEAAINLGIIYLSSGRNDQAIVILEKALGLAGGIKKSKTLNLLGKAYNKSGIYFRAEESLVEAINLKPSDLDSRIELAKVYSNREDNSKAEEMFNEVLLLDDSNSEALMGLAGLSLLEGKLTETEEFLERALTATPYFDEGRLKLARLLAENDRTDEAIPHLLWIMDNGSDLSGASFQLGLISYNKGDYDKAAIHYENAFDYSDETHLESLNNLALSLKSLGKLDEAATTLIKAVEIDPRYEKAHYNLGLIYLEDEEPQSALDSFRTVTWINPLHEQAWYNIGYIHSQRGAVKASIDSYERTLEINPANIKCRLNLAVQYSKDGQSEKAEKQYDIVLSINPAYASAWYNLGLLLKRRDNLNEAEEAYLKAIDLEPENAKYRYSLALAYVKSENWQSAISVLEEALEISPEDQNLRLKLAKILTKVNLMERAEEEYRKILALDDSYVNAWLALASLQTELNDYEEALDSYNRALSLNEQDVYLHYLKGKILYKMKRYGEAIRNYEIATSSITDNSWIWYHLGKAQDKIGEEEKADESYNRSMEINPNMGKFIINKLEYTEDSFTLLESMINEDPENSSLYIQLAQLYFREGDSDRATRLLETFFLMNDEDPDLWEQAGDTAADGGNPILAEKFYTNLLRMDPMNGNGNYKLALLIEERGDNISAIEEFEKAAELMNPPYKAIVKLGKLNYMLKEYSKSVLYFEKAMEIDDSDDSLLYDLGKAYYRNRQYDKALTTFETSKERRNDHIWTLIWLGRTYARLKKFREAESHYRKAVEMDPQFIQSYIGLGDLAVLENKDSDAVSFYERALGLDPLHESVRNKLTRLKN